MRAFTALSIAAKSEPDTAAPSDAIVKARLGFDIKGNTAASIAMSASRFSSNMYQRVYNADHTVKPPGKLMKIMAPIGWEQRRSTLSLPYYGRPVASDQAGQTSTEFDLVFLSGVVAFHSRASCSANSLRP
jgi:hypothetical protein